MVATMVDELLIMSANMPLAVNADTTVDTPFVVSVNAPNPYIFSELVEKLLIVSSNVPDAINDG